MTNRDLLKEAIADAKAVKETAIANAKAALEEAFTPHLKSMLSAKLEEMEKEDEMEEGYKSDESMEEAMESEMEDKMEEGIEEEMIDLDEILAEIEKEDMDESISESEEVAEQEEEEAEEEESEEMEGEEEEEIDLEEMSEEDLKSFIEEVIADMVESGELEAGEEFESEDEMEMGDEEIEVEDEDEIMEEKEDLEEMDAVSKRQKDSPAGETLADNAPKKVGQSTVQEAGFDTADSAAAGFEEIVKGLKAMAKKGGEIGQKALAALEDLGAGAGYAMRKEEEEMDEIEELKKELQEVNLLNAKLLYTNKIFRSKNLSEDKKLKVLKSFDKAGTVKEAKMIFDTLNEGLTETSKKSVNEVKGSASKPMGVAPVKKQPIVENDAFRRMQELAGIIKN